MPHLAKLQEEHKDKLIAIGPHCQNVPMEDVIALCRSMKINFTITNGGSVEGIKWNGIPKIFAFDHTGALFFNGRPDEGFNKALDAALKAAPDPLVGDHKYEKLRSQAAAATSRRGLGKALAEVRTLVKDPDPATAQEAGWLLSGIEPYGRDLLERAKRAEATDPIRALESYTRVASLFSGDILGNEADEALKRLKADAAFQQELGARQALAKIDKAKEDLRPCRYGEPLDPANCAACKKKNFELLNGMVIQLKSIIKKYDGTLAAKDADALLKSFGG